MFNYLRFLYASTLPHAYLLRLGLLHELRLNIYGKKKELELCWVDELKLLILLLFLKDALEEDPA